MTRKFFAPDSGIKSVNIEGMRTGTNQRIARDSKGFFNAESKSQASALKAEGFVEASLTGAAPKAGGFHCDDCGFEGWFKKCGRCGNEECKKVGEE